MKNLTLIILALFILPLKTNVAGNGIEMDKMAKVPAGYFRYGKKNRKIYLKEFYIDTRELSLRLFGKQFGSMGGSYPITFQDRCDSSWDKNHPDINKGAEATVNDSINCISWSRAQEVCRRMGKRLPTEMEWEKAARGTDGQPYPWGKEDPDCEHAVLSVCGDVNYARKPCTRPKGNSPYGLCDMIGNVGEWVISARDEGPDDIHIYKGGSFIYPYNPSPWKPYVWKRYRSFPAAEAGIGVRCVWSKTDHNIKLLPTVKERGF